MANLGGQAAPALIFVLVCGCGEDSAGDDPMTVGGSEATAGSSETGGTTSEEPKEEGGAPDVSTQAGSSSEEPDKEDPGEGGAESSGGSNTNGGEASGGSGMPRAGRMGMDTAGSSSEQGGTSEPETGGVPDAGAMTDGGEDVMAGSGGGEDLPEFSFFVTSYRAISELVGPDGFGGDLRYGEETGLEGADKICAEIAEMSMPGSAVKQWRAFLSVAVGPDGEQVDAIDRIGEGPWYDRVGRVVAMTKADLQQTRPQGADPAIIDDLPNEDGIGNHAPDGVQIDNHHVLTGSDEEGRLYGPNATCADWTSLEKSADGRPRIGFSWPAQGRQHWISGQDEGGCMAGFDLDGGGGSDPNVGTVGSGGGYGGIYCFALTP